MCKARKHKRKKRNELHGYLKISSYFCFRGRGCVCVCVPLSHPDANTHTEVRSLSLYSFLLLSDKGLLFDSRGITSSKGQKRGNKPYRWGKEGGREWERKEVGQNDEEGRKQGRIENKGDWEGSEEGVGSEGSVQAGCVLVHSCLHTGTLWCWNRKGTICCHKVTSTLLFKTSACWSNDSSSHWKQSHTQTGQKQRKEKCMWLELLCR